MPEKYLSVSDKPSKPSTHFPPVSSRYKASETGRCGSRYLRPRHSGRMPGREELDDIVESEERAFVNFAIQIIQPNAAGYHNKQGSDCAYVLLCPGKGGQRPLNNLRSPWRAR